MVKLLLTFIRPLEYAIADEKQPGAIGNLSKELLELRNDLKDFMDIAKDLVGFSLQTTRERFVYKITF